MNCIEEKMCKKCEKRKPISDFYTKGEGRTDAKCKECIRMRKFKLYNRWVQSKKNLKINRKKEIQLIPVIFGILERRKNNEKEI